MDGAARGGDAAAGTGEPGDLWITRLRSQPHMIPNMTTPNSPERRSALQDELLNWISDESEFGGHATPTNFADGVRGWGGVPYAQSEVRACARNLMDRGLVKGRGAKGGPPSPIFVVITEAGRSVVQRGASVREPISPSSTMNISGQNVAVLTNSRGASVTQTATAWTGEVVSQLGALRPLIESLPDGQRSELDRMFQDATSAAASNDRDGAKTALQRVVDFAQDSVSGGIAGVLSSAALALVHSL